MAAIEAHARQVVTCAAQAERLAVVRVCRIDDLGPMAGERLTRFVAEGRHGDMDWFPETLDRRRHPNAMWPEARSAVVVGASYAPAHDPLAILRRPDRAAVSIYAHAKDYHDTLKPRLKRIAGALQRATGADVKVFVDTAPLMEKPLAALAGVGWQGKHTNLVSPAHGSWLFLGTILTTAALEPDAPARDQCGTCRRCLDVCPTAAFVAPYQLDARRCISYLTIEHKGPIPLALRTGMGNRVFGCDDCLAVCPWNKFARAAHEQQAAARLPTDGLPLAELLALDEAGFRSRFAGTPVRRPGYLRFMRNVLIAAGNSGLAALVPAVAERLSSPSALVRGAAVWAMGRIAGRDEIVARSRAHLDGENDPNVRMEWTRELES